MFGFIWLRKTTCFAVFCSFLLGIFLKEKFYNASDFDWEKNNALDFKLKQIKRVRFWIEIFHTGQILN